MREPLQAGVSLQCLFFGIPEREALLCRVCALSSVPGNRRLVVGRVCSGPRTILLR